MLHQWALIVAIVALPTHAFAQVPSGLLSGVQSGYDYRYEYNYQPCYRPLPYRNCWRTTVVRVLA
jgi:hypothetical protein